MNEEKTTAAKQFIKKEKIPVRSAWLFPINGEVLISASGTYWLMSAEKWPMKIKFEIFEDEFVKLSQPEQLTSDSQLNENLWRSGIVRKLDNYELPRIQQAVHLTKYSVDEVINLLKGNK